MTGIGICRATALRPDRVVNSDPKRSAALHFQGAEAALSQQYRLYAERGAGFAQAAVECAEGGAVIGADGEMQGVTGAQAQSVLIGVAGGGAELLAADRQ